MAIGLESLIVAAAFILPGFLTSKLISSKTPKRRVESSAFEDTAESILRSVYINLLVAAVLLILYHAYLKFQAIPEIQELETVGPFEFGQANPFTAAQAFVLWLIVAFAIATFFGLVWDPLYAAMDRTSRSHGGLSEDAFALLRTYTVKRNDETSSPSQLWIRARMHSGNVYRGEFVSASFREGAQSRELLLTHARYVDANSAEEGNDIGERIDFVLLDLSNVDSVEFILSGSSGGSDT